MQIQQLTAVLEIFSNVSVEFATFFSMVDLVPYLVMEIKESLTALSSQAITENLLPAEDLSLKIPTCLRTSLLVGQITPKLNADKFLLVITIPQFFPVFTLNQIMTVPFNPLPPNNFQFLRLEDKVVAVNSSHETFFYDPFVCVQHKTITICPFHFLQIEHRQTTCSEALVTDNQDYAGLCLNRMGIFKPTYQSFIYRNHMKSIRLFSPFTDVAAYICGAMLKLNSSVIHIGYNDFMFRAGCMLKTKDLTLLRPILVIDETDVLHVEASLPDVAEAFARLTSDLEVTHQLNLTKMLLDYEKLSALINNESMDIMKIQAALQKASAINSLEDYEPFKPQIQNPNSVATSVAVLSISVVLITFIVIVVIIHIQ